MWNMPASRPPAFNCSSSFSARTVDLPTTTSARCPKVCAAGAASLSVPGPKTMRLAGANSKRMGCVPAVFAREDVLIDDLRARLGLQQLDRLGPAVVRHPLFGAVGSSLGLLDSHRTET